MDRLAIAGIALGLVIGAVGLARGRDALATRAQAAMAEARVATAQRDVDRLRSLPPDRLPLRTITDTLVLLDHGMLAPTPLRVRAQPEPPTRHGNLWAPFRGEMVTITMQTDVSPTAAIAWLDIALKNYALLLTGIQWDGRTASVRAVVLSP